MSFNIQKAQAEVDKVASILQGRATHLSGSQMFGIAGGCITHKGERYDLFCTAAFLEDNDMVVVTIERIGVKGGMDFRLVTGRRTYADNELSQVVITVPTANHPHFNMFNPFERIGKLVARHYDSGLRRNRGRKQAQDRKNRQAKESLAEFVRDTGVTEEQAQELFDLVKPFCASGAKAYDLAIKLADQLLTRNQAIDAANTSLDEVSRDLYMHNRNSEARAIEKVMTALEAIKV